MNFDLYLVKYQFSSVWYIVPTGSDWGISVEEYFTKKHNIPSSVFEQLGTVSRLGSVSINEHTLEMIAEERPKTIDRFGDDLVLRLPDVRKILPEKASASR